MVLQSINDLLWQWLSFPFSSIFWGSFRERTSALKLPLSVTPPFGMPCIPWSLNLHLVKMGEMAKIGNASLRAFGSAEDGCWSSSCLWFCSLTDFLCFLFFNPRTNGPSLFPGLCSFPSPPCKYGLSLFLLTLFVFFYSIKAGRQYLRFLSTQKKNIILITEWSALKHAAFEPKLRKSKMKKHHCVL